MKNNKKKFHHRRNLRVTPQTAYNLEKLAQMSGIKCPGRVVDKLVRDKMKSLHIPLY